MDRFENTLVPPNGAVANSSLLSRRRKSRASRSYAARKNSAAVDPASPEVISSLISSLSTISVPLQSHFDNVPCVESANLPSAPSFLQTEFPTPDQRPHTSHEPSFGAKYGIPRTPQEPEDPYLHPDDAAAAPVVRMARQPPTPKTKATFDPPSSPMRPASRGSYTSAKMAYEDAAFGTVSAEPIMPASKAPSIASSSSGGRKSLKGTLGLFRKNSRGSVNEKEGKADRLRKTRTHSEGQKNNVPRSRASLRSKYSMANVVEEGRSRSVKTESRATNAVSTPLSGEDQSSHGLRESATNNAPGGIGSNRAIPTRDSTLRHKNSTSSKHHHLSARHTRHPSSGSKDTKVDSGVFGTGSNEAEQVTKRIQEL